MRLKDKVAVITGVSSGIGKALTELFIREGAYVVGVARRETLLQEMAKELGNHFLPYCGDVASQKTNEEMIDTAIETFGHLDILVNNAGMVDQSMTVEHMTNEMWEKTMAVNLTAPMYAIRYFIAKKMSDKTQGCIVSTSSVGGNAFPLICGAAYAASKAALNQLTRHVAYTYGRDGIRCNAICVGACPSTGIASTFTNPDMDGLKNSSQLNKLSIRDAQPIELANAILFLASDEASYVNGAIVNVDGGWSAV